VWVFVLSHKELCNIFSSLHTSQHFHTGSDW
jgi:hypothetical protein